MQPLTADWQNELASHKLSAVLKPNVIGLDFVNNGVIRVIVFYFLEHLWLLFLEI